MVNLPPPAAPSLQLTAVITVRAPPLPHNYTLTSDAYSLSHSVSARAHTHAHTHPEDISGAPV